MALRPSDIPAKRVRALNAGAPASNLAEMLAIDLGVLIRSACPGLAAAAIERMHAAQRERLGIVRRMELGGELLARHATGHLPVLHAHSSDMVRGWACYAIVKQPGYTAADTLAAVRPFADDPYSGVREWAWMAARPALAADLPRAIKLLKAWTKDPSPNIRRFATEATRPRGVWCQHLTALRQDPEPGLVLLEPLKADASMYVQDSVSNWLNDAAKDHPDFVRDVTGRWLKQSDEPATRRICRRACRSLAE